MRIKNQVLLAALALFICVCALVGIYVYTEFRVDTSTIDYIYSMQKSPNEFLDLSNDINVSSVDDVKYIIEGEYKLRIYYGDQVIEMNRNCFKSDEFRNKLSQIGVKVYTHEDTETNEILYRVTYWEQDCTEYSRIE